MCSAFVAILLQAGGAGASAAPMPAATSGSAQSQMAQDSAARVARRARLRAERTVAVTPALLASAFDGSPTRALIELARHARAVDDSSLREYDVESVSRFTVKLQIGVLGRERLLFRRDRAEHARWQRGVGAIVDVTGSRQVLPMAPSEAQGTEEEAIALPYVPGRRTLALGGQRGADTTQYTEIDDIVDPLAPGAEAYYRYTAGDSETISFPSQTGGSQVLHLREIRLHARRPTWNIGLGSLWFDAASGHLVRAVYRFSAPMDVVAIAKESDPHAFDDVPIWLKPMITPITASLDAVTIEYSLLEGKYWLPIARYADGDAHVNLMRASVRWEVRYHYTSVNGPGTVPKLPERAPPDTANVKIVATDGAQSSATSATLRPSGLAFPPSAPLPAPADSTSATARGGRSKGSAHIDMRSGGARNGQTDEAEHRRRAAQCAQQSTWDHVEVHDGGAVRILVRTPCDSVALARSSALPPSIYDPGDATFATADASVLRSLLSSQPQPDWSPRPIQLRWGLQDGLIRYNRVEGLSAGVAGVEELGLGLSVRAEGRLGIADLQPNGELQITRASWQDTIGVGVYRRLVSANDWGDPFTVGSSIWSLLFGDDEGFYYRAWGAEVRGVEPGSVLPFSWRLFVEREWTASVGTRFALTDAFGGARMSSANVIANAGTLAGLSVRIRPTWGLDPQGFQGSADIRGEGAGGSYSYVRGAADLTEVHPVTRLADAAATVGAGTSAGDVPPQRLWYLGGLRTVRGIAPGAQSGNAYWLGHVELGLHGDIIRPLVFYDIGWAGDRDLWAKASRPLSGAGIGASILDGLIRLDIGRGIWPTHAVRVNAYWQGTF